MRGLCHSVGSRSRDSFMICGRYEVQIMESFEDIAARLETPKDFVRWGASAFNRAGLHFEHGTANAVDEALNLVLHGLSLSHDIPPWLLDGRLTQAEKQSVYGLLRRRVEERK